jgi:hypothetical protein
LAPHALPSVHVGPHAGGVHMPATHRPEPQSELAPQALLSLQWLGMLAHIGGWQTLAAHCWDAQSWLDAQA